MSPIDEMKDDKKVYVAVKFMGDDSTKHEFVTSDKIKKFNPALIQKTENNHNYKYNNPYYVYKFDTVKQEDIAVPANLLFHADSLEELENNTKRFRYPKTRLSAALEKLAEEELDTSDDDDQGSPVTSKKPQKTANEKTRATDQSYDGGESPKKSEKCTKDLRKTNTVKSTSLKEPAKSKKKEAAYKEAEKQQQKELILRKARKLMEDEKTVEEKVSSTEPTFSHNPPPAPVVSETIASDQNVMQLESLERANQILRDDSLKKEAEIEKLQFDLVVSQSKEEAPQKELQETLTILQSLTIKTEEKINKLKQTIRNLKTVNEESSCTESKKVQGDDTHLLKGNSPLFTGFCANDDKEFSTPSSPRSANYKRRLFSDISPLSHASPKKQKMDKEMGGTLQMAGDVSRQQNLMEKEVEAGEKTKTVKSKLIKKSVHDYDSEDYGNDSKLSGDKKPQEDFTEFKMEKKDGIYVRMFHLCYGYSLKYQDWKQIRDARTASIFVNKLALHLYGARELVLRAIDVSKAEERKDRASPRKPITPKKAGIIRKSYVQYLLRKGAIKAKVVDKIKNKKLCNQDDKKEKQLLNGWTTHLSNAIDSTYHKYKNIEQNQGVINASSNEGGSDEGE